MSSERKADCWLAVLITSEHALASAVVPTDYLFADQRTTGRLLIGDCVGGVCMLAFYVVGAECGHLLNQLSCLLSRIQPHWLTTVNYLRPFQIPETLPCWYIPSDCTHQSMAITHFIPTTTKDDMSTRSSPHTLVPLIITSGRMFTCVEMCQQRSIKRQHH